MAVSVTTPEPASDIAAQLRAVLDPAHPKDAMFVAAGEGALPDAPEGLHAVHRAEGSLYTSRADKAVWYAGLKAPNDDHIARLLDYIETKASAMAHPMGPLVMQALDAAGAVITEMLISGPSTYAAIDHLQPHAGPGGRLTIITPDAGQARRAALRAQGDR